MYNSFAIPWTVAHNAPLFMEFPRQEYWSGLPFSSQGIFLTQGSNLPLLLGRHSLSLNHLGTGWWKLQIPIVVLIFEKKNADDREKNLRKWSFLYDLRIYILNHYCTLAFFSVQCSTFTFSCLPSLTISFEKWF